MLIFIIFFTLLTAYMWYRGIKASKSGSLIGGFMSPTREEDKNMPFYKTWQGVFALILTAADIAIIWAVLAAR